MRTKKNSKRDKGADGKFQKGNTIGHRFKEGNSGGPGRPRRQVEREYLDALIGCVSLAAWKAIVARAVKDAKAGDHRAREWIGKYLVGTDPIVAELSEEVELLKRKWKLEREGR